MTTVFPSVVVFPGPLPADKSGFTELVPVGRAPTVELAPAIMLLASAGEIVAVVEGEDGSEVGVGCELLPLGVLVLTNCIIASAPVSMKVRVGPMTISWLN
jgi:hypothetical protein